MRVKRRESGCDSYLWQIVEQKQKFISQIMTSKSVERNCEGVDETVLKKDIEVIVDEDSLSEDNERSEDFREKECDEMVI